VQRAREAGATARLIVKEGQAHGWPRIQTDLATFVDWFDEHLLGKKP
jgi:hypothetical protein